MFRLFLFLSLVSFIISLCLPVYAGEQGKLGILAFLGGWTVFLNDVPTAISWLANVLYVFAVICIFKKKKPKPIAATVLAILALIFGCAIFVSGEILHGYSETLRSLPLGTAIYPWMSSFVLMAIAGLLKRKKLLVPVQPTANPVPAEEA